MPAIRATGVHEGEGQAGPYATGHRGHGPAGAALREAA